MEEKLALIWQEAVGKTGIGVLDNFFEIGGNSLSATRVVARIHEEMRAIWKYAAYSLIQRSRVWRGRSLVAGTAAMSRSSHGAAGFL